MNEKLMRVILAVAELDEAWAHLPDELADELTPDGRRLMYATSRLMLAAQAEGSLAAALNCFRKPLVSGAAVG